MNNEFYTPDGVENPAIVPGPTESAAPQEEVTDPVAEKQKMAKKAFSRVGLAVLILFLVMQGIGTVVIVAGMLANIFSRILSAFQQNSEILNNGVASYVQNLMSDAMENLTAFSLIGTLAGLVVALLIAKKILQKTPVFPIERKRLSVSEYFFMLFVALGLWGVGAVTGNLPSICGLDSPLDNMLGSGEGVWGVLFTLYAMFGAPILEELAFRKLLLDRLNPYGEVPAAFLSALLFGLFHGNSTQFILAFMVGLAFATVYLKTGNVWYSISFHMIINTVASATDIVSLFTDATEFLGLDFGVWQMILIGLFGIAGTVFAIVNRKHPLLALKRPDYGNCNRLVFRNPGFIIFAAVVSVSILSTDFIALMMNLFPTDNAFEPKAFLALIPTAIYAVSLILLLKTVGTHSDAPEPLRADFVPIVPEEK